MSEENKVRFGLSNVHVGTVTLSDGTPSFSIPKKYPGAVKLTMDAEGETNTLYADNIAYYVTNTNTVILESWKWQKFQTGLKRNILVL